MADLLQCKRITDKRNRRSRSDIFAGNTGDATTTLEVTRLFDAFEMTGARRLR
jgi:hypothetical protein